MFPYRIVTEWSDEDACYIARVPALQNCAAHGDTPEQAAHEAQVAARLMLDVLGEKAPPPDVNAEYSGNIRLRLPRYLHADLARRADAEGVSLNQLMVSILAGAR
ncbi:MAG: type II toxin-antitoxin system HicB family antitoxin [Polyangiaceae bacterium]|nr:type II toxin-antitoxin system HicB family antitoxin [Polyangiaceae bacterium]